jgi:serine/threonine protein phosphatase PrpC
MSDSEAPAAPVAVPTSEPATSEPTTTAELSTAELSTVEPTTVEPTNGVAASCPACGTPTTPGERFCESCGAELPGAAEQAQPVADPDAAPVELTDRVAPPSEPADDGIVVDAPDLAAVPTTCPECGGRVAGDGYCEQCGARPPKARDHWLERPAGWVAAVCDRGIRHQANEDAVALAARAQPASFAVLVVCDGVSSAPQSDVASLAAARAARDVLVASVTGPPVTPEELLTRAAAAANDAATRTAVGLTGPNPPSCTFVAALVTRTGPDAARAAVAWIGDSRAYWFPDTGEPLQISIDDSWAAEAMTHGGLSRAEAERLPQAHAITRWLGEDSPDGPPRTALVDVSAAGWLLVCSDGLWNYCSAPEDLGPLLAQTAQRVGDDPAAIATALTGWANEQGGHDNITVALARCGVR